MVQVVIGVVVSVPWVVGAVVLVFLSSGGMEGVVVVCNVEFSGGLWCIVVVVDVGGGVVCVVAIGVGWGSDCVELVDGAMIDGWVVGGVGFSGNGV
jgi:hypothetical protein